MGYGNKIAKRVPINTFIELIKKYTGEQIECTDHTFFRLNESQRRIYNPAELRKIIKKETPILVGVQYNGAYAAFYRYKNKIMRIILSLDNRKVNIVTFYFINEWQIPKI